MKTTFLAFSVLLSFWQCLGVYAQKGNTLNPGDALPAKGMTFKNVTGDNVDLYTATGKKGLLVMFSCNTCPFVIKNQTVTEQTISYAEENFIGVVIVNSNQAKRDGEDSYDAMKQYASKLGYTVPYIADDNSKLADMFGANHTPEIFLFDSEHKLVYKGAMNDNPGDPSAATKSYINEAINELVAGKEIKTKVTKSIGCSIKRKA